MFTKKNLHLTLCAFPGGLLEFILGVSTFKKNDHGLVCTNYRVVKHRLKPLKSISVYILMCIKLKNLMFANNYEFPTIRLIGVGTWGHQQFDLALHLVHWVSVNGIRHPQFNVIFRVYTPLKICIQETTRAIELFDQKFGVYTPSKGRPYGLHKKQSYYQIGSGGICDEHTPSPELPFWLWCNFLHIVQ
jgi:hypothetical protein